MLRIALKCIVFDVDAEVTVENRFRVNFAVEQGTMLRIGLQCTVLNFQSVGPKALGLALGPGPKALGLAPRPCALATNFHCSVPGVRCPVSGVWLPGTY